VWSTVKDSVYPGVFEEFLDKFPSSQHIKEAQARRDQLKKQAEAMAVPPPHPWEIVWDAIKDSQFASVFQEYLNKFPDSGHRDDARRRLGELNRREEEELKKKQVTALVLSPPPIDQAATGKMDLKLKVLDEAAEVELKPKAIFKECDKCPEM